MSSSECGRCTFEPGQLRNHSTLTAAVLQCTLTGLCYLNRAHGFSQREIYLLSVCISLSATLAVSPFRSLSLSHYLSFSLSLIISLSLSVSLSLSSSLCMDQPSQGDHTHKPVNVGCMFHCLMTFNTHVYCSICNCHSKHLHVLSGGNSPLIHMRT